MIDLHCHSLFSDGLDSPQALFNQAVAADVRVLALTDHDTLSGLSCLHAVAAASASLDQSINSARTSLHPSSGIEVTLDMVSRQPENKSFKDSACTGRDACAVQIINGIEWSTRWKKHDVHILGLAFNDADPDTQMLVAQQRACRIARALKISECLALFGVHDAYDKACVVAGHERVGRPHFAHILVQEGLVKDQQTAFKRFLGRGRPAYVPTLWVELEKAVEIIVRGGGQAVIAHPLKYGLTRSKLHELINDFKTAGGVGMEVVSGDMSDAHIAEAAGLCQRFHLLASSGSDYHGQGLSRIALGRQRPLPVNCKPIWEQWIL